MSFREVMQQEAVDVWLNHRPDRTTYQVILPTRDAVQYQALRVMRSGALVCYTVSPGGITDCAQILAPGSWLSIV